MPGTRCSSATCCAGRRPASWPASSREFTVVNLPSFQADPKRHGVRTETVIACNFAKRLVLIGGTSYAGETKKSVFTYLNYAMPETGVMPMHCSANVGPDGDCGGLLRPVGHRQDDAVGRPQTHAARRRRARLVQTTASTISRAAATPRPSASRKEAEPEIWAATNRFGTVLENVILDPGTRVPDFDDGRLTENTRSAYPLEFISNASKTGTAGHPKNIVMLTADAFGVLPPIAKLSPSQAMYHFLSGYTAKVAGTEKGLGNEPQATFSTCFGAPFMPRHPSVYGNMLRELIAKHKVDCWLVNTGWTGGKYGVGQRMPIKATRALLDAALVGRAEVAADAHRSAVRLPGADGAAGRRPGHPQSARDLGRQGRLRRAGARAGRHVQQELREVRGARRRRREGRRPGAASSRQAE